jgi:23S rRNA (uracil-5-)-methyltransferase RumA
VEDPRARQALNAVARIAEHLHVSAYDEDRGTGVLRNAVVRVGYASDDVLLVIVTNGPELPHLERFVSELRTQRPELTSVVQNVNTRRTNAILGRLNKTLYGPGNMHDQLLGCTFEIGPSSFYQTNPAQAEVLYRLAIDGAQLLPGQRVLDAYCGTGTIGICAVSHVDDLHVVGVEQVSDAVACARRNARANGLGDRCRFLRSDATDYMDATIRTTRPDDRFDVVIMDPPRSGSSHKFLAGVTRLGPSRIAYVSCCVSTQTRDITILRDYGYRLERVTPVDMFPHTKHVENVAVLARETR